MYISSCLFLLCYLVNRKTDPNRRLDKLFFLNSRKPGSTWSDDSWNDCKILSSQSPFILTSGKTKVNERIWTFWTENRSSELKHRSHCPLIRLPYLWRLVRLNAMLPLQNMYLQARQTTPLVRRPAHYNGDISTVTSSRLYVVQSTKVFTNNPHSKNRSLVTDSWCHRVTPSRSPPSDWLRWEREQNSSSPSRCPTATAGGVGAGLHVKAVKMFNYDNTAPDLAYLIYQIMTQLDWGCVCVWVRTHPSTEYHEVLQ